MNPADALLLLEARSAARALDRQVTVPVVTMALDRLGRQVSDAMDLGTARKAGESYHRKVLKGNPPKS